MTPALRAEVRKLRWTRSLLAVLGAGLVIAVLGTVLLMAAGRPAEIPERLSRYGPLRFGPTNFGLLLVVFGVRLFADEVQHRTLAATLVRTPDRRRVLTAKLVVVAAVAAAFTVAVYLVVIPITVVGLRLRHLEMTYDLAATGALLGRVLLASLVLAAIGVAVGAAIRNRTVALVAVLVWFSLAEDLIGPLLHIARFLPSAAMQSLVAAEPGAATSGPLGALILVVCGIAATAAALVTLRRDIP
jgi:hypothetical protein